MGFYKPTDYDYQCLVRGIENDHEPGDWAYEGMMKAIQESPVEIGKWDAFKQAVQGKFPRIIRTRGQELFYLLKPFKSVNHTAGKPIWWNAAVFDFGDTAIVNTMDETLGEPAPFNLISKYNELAENLCLENELSENVVHGEAEFRSMVDAFIRETFGDDASKS